jgi:hypothetical protein
MNSIKAYQLQGQNEVLRQLFLEEGAVRSRAAERKSQEPSGGKSRIGRKPRRLLTENQPAPHMIDSILMSMDPRNMAAKGAKSTYVTGLQPK